MLTLYKSSSLNTLFTAWSDLISQPSPGGPLRPRSVIVPNMDMAQWLQVHQAERSGISANIDFQLPAGYFRKIFEARMGAGSKQLLDKHQLRWMAFTLLGEALETGQYPREWEVLVEWIKTASQNVGGARDMRGIRWDLAGQIADVFDQYIMYRPHWLRDWARGDGGVGGQDMVGDFASSDDEPDNGYGISANQLGRGNPPGDGRKILGSTLTSIVGGYECVAAIVLG